MTIKTFDLFNTYFFATVFSVDAFLGGMNCKKGEIYQMMAALLCGEELITTICLASSRISGFSIKLCWYLYSTQYLQCTVDWADFLF